MVQTKLKNPMVDKYLIDGCMRCKFGATPLCKVNNWRDLLELLRQIVLESGLTENIKWGVPCYTTDNKNVVIISAFKEFASLGFFKGALMTDKYKILLKQGESSQSSRIIKFTDINQIIEQKEVILSYIREAIQIEKEGKKVNFIKNPEPVPEQLEEFFLNEPEFKKAFQNLTAGKQRAYIIYFSQPKQAQTRISRIEKCKSKIFKGEGLNDKYLSKTR